MKQITLTFFLALTAIAGAAAQSMQLIQDLAPGQASGVPGIKVVLNNKLYFYASDPTYGCELRSCDGNTISLVYDLNPGAASGLSSSLILSGNPVVFNGKVYFPGNNGTNGTELMAYDGVNPPVIAADLNPGSASSFPRYLAVAGNRMYFMAGTAAAGIELYVYDGVNAPVLYNIEPGTFSSEPQNFVGFKGKVYFSATMAATGRELYVYNPAVNTVALAADIVPGSLGSEPYLSVILNDRLYFVAATGTHGKEIWSYDGTSATRVTDVAAGSLDGVSSTPGVYDGQLYFSGSTDGSLFQLYRYNPATGITALVYNIFPGGSAAPGQFWNYNGKLYFTATDAAHGSELWMYNGTAASLVAEIEPGAGNGSPILPQEYGGLLYYTGLSSATGYELYRLNTPTAISNLPDAIDVSVAPNPAPANAMLRLKLRQETLLRIELTDAEGRICWQQSLTWFPAGESSVELPVRGMSAGLYFYQILGVDGSHSTGRLNKL